MVVTTVVLASLVGVLAPTTAYAAGTVLFQNSFADRTVDGTGTVTTPAPVSGPNVACLTATGNSATLPLLSCSGTSDAQGSGKLRLTPAVTNSVGAIFGQSSFPSSNGLDVTFTTYQWGGNGADGMAFMLAAVDPANPVSPGTVGGTGGALGYSTGPGQNGLANAYLGVGLDAFGNFSSSAYSGTGCAVLPNTGSTIPGAVVVRGPGNLKVGYCALATTYDGTAGSKATLRAVTRAPSAVPVQVLINPTTSPFTSDSGVSVASGTYKVVVTPVGQSAKTLTGPLPAVAAGLAPASWLSAAGVPKQLAFGFLGSTGSVTDNHEISNVKVLTFNPVPQLASTTTAYSAPTSGPGDPVTYQVAATVLAGADETKPVSITQTVPTGVVPVGAYGAGWVCAAPVGRSITCTTSASSFANGTALPGLTVSAIVTGSGVSAALVRSNSTTRVSAADANPGVDTAATAGTVPGAPTGVAANPAIGPVAGGGLVSVTASTNSAPPTAIEIGTPAEQQAGTPVVLLPCPSGRAVGCFTIEGSALVILSMPPRADPATVTVTVVTLGVATAATYVYAASPTAPVAPTATAGITSATLNWAAPAANGSPITGYVVTPYLGGAAQAPQTFDASTTTRTFTGLTAGSSYTFTVAAINAYGTSAASPKSAAVVPYTLPGAPTITAATAGSQAATLTWTAPGTGGSPITGYVVTPFVGGVAQPTQTVPGTTATVTGLTPGTAYTFTVAAQNLAGTGPASAPSAAVTPNQSPSLTFAAPPAGQVGVAYSRQLTATNGTSPFVWSVSAGSLPGGITLGAAGLLAGTPTAAGSFTFTVRVVDASGQSATKAVTLVIAAAPALSFSPAPGQVGVAYSQQPTLTGGTGPFAWAVGAGSLPAGITLNPSTGLLSGTPTAAGSFAVTITVTDAFGQLASRTVTLVVVGPPTLAGAAPPGGQVGVAYSTTFAVTGGTGPYVWAVPAGSTPPGLTFDAATGVLSGTPTTVGSSPFTVSVTDANSQTATRAVTLVIGTGPLVIVKAANVSSAEAGGIVAYTVTVTNTGSSAFAGVAVSDPLTGVLDDATYNADATATSGTVTYTAPTLGWTGNLAAGAAVTIGYSVTVDNPDAGNKVLANSVTSATPGTNCASGGTDPRCSATVTVAGLTIVTTADTATTTPGGTVGLRIVVTNAGQTAYPAATLTDSLAGVLDDAVYNADAAATSGNLSYTSPSLTWTGALAPGASATITYTVTVADPDSGNRSLTTTVVSPSAGSPCPAVSPAAQCTATVTVLVPALSITTGAGSATTTPGSTVTYTATISNTGQTPYTGPYVSIALAAALDDATYDGNATATAGGVVFDPGAGALVWTGDLAVGAVATVTWSVTVRSPDPGDRTLTTVAASAAPGSTCPAASPNPACTTTVAVRLPALTLATSADVSTTTPGSVVRQTLTVTNTGQTPYLGATATVALVGVLDDAAYDADVTTTAGTASFSGSTITWNGDLAVGASATITYSVTVADPDTGDRTLNTAVTSATPGSTCPAAGADPRCTDSVAVLIPGLSVTNLADTATTTPGSVVNYAVTVANNGQTAYTGLAVTLDLAGALDDADYNFDATITTGSLVTKPDGTVDWVLDLAPGATATGTISVTVKDPAVGDRALRVVVVSEAAGSPCRVGSAAPECSSLVTVLRPGLVITTTAATGTVSPGGTVGYTVTVRNSGETAYPAAGFTDDLSRVLDDATYTGGAVATTGTVSYAAPTLSWTGALAPGASATISYSITVRDPDPGDKYLVNDVVSAAPGNNCPAGGTDPRCTATVTVLVPGLTIVTTASPPTTAPGATVAHSVAVTNSGATALTAATVTVSLTGVLDDADYDADATADSGSVSYAAPVLTWTGNLAIGATAVVTYSVTVHRADGGNNLLTSTVTSTTGGSNCAAGGTDGRCTVTVPVARLVLTQTAGESTTTPGSVVHLTQTFTNTGQVPYTGISVVSPRADTADDTVPTGDQIVTSGTLVRTDTAITWTGSIPVGGGVTSTRTLVVKNPDPGDHRITATLLSTAAGNNCPAGGADTRCTFLITVLTPALTITKTASTTATVPGGTVGYTVTVHNTGQTPYTAAVVTDSLTGVLDKAGYDNDATATTGAVVFSAATLTWTGDLAVGASAVVTYSVTVSSAPSGDKTMVNSVGSSTVGSTCPPRTTEPACRSAVVILTPALTIVKTADLTNATLGSSVTYTITATNTGQTDYPAAAFTDSLAGVLDDATYHPASATSGTVGYAGGVLSWAGALGLGETATVTYSVTINNPASGDRIMGNTVTSTTIGNNCPAAAADARCTVAVPITDAVSLTFTTTADVVSTVAGGVVTYTVTVVNSSGSDVAGAEFKDPLTGVLDDATYNADAAASAGAVSYTYPNLAWSGTVPAAGTVTVTYSVTVLTSLAGDEILANTVTSTSLPGSNNCIAASGDPRCSATVPVAALRIVQTSDETAATPGSVVHLHQSFTNTGQAPYAGISVVSPRADTSDDTVPTGDQTASSGTLVRTAAAVTWTGDVPVGGVVTTTRTVLVKDPDPGNRRITATVVSAAPGNNCPSGTGDPSCTFLVSVVTPALTITKSASTSYVTPGSTAAYTITVANSGETPYVGAAVTDTLVGVLDDATYNADATTTTGALSFESPTLTWTGDLAVGASATIGYTVTARSPATGDKAMINPVSSDTVGSSCPPASGNTACSSVVAVLTPALIITSAADVATSVPGAAVTYTITATNTGQLPNPAASLGVALGGVLDDATYGGGATASTGTVAITGQNLTWTGALGVGDTVTITYAVTVDRPVTGDFRLGQTVVSADPGGNCPAGGTDPRCTVEVAVASLGIVNATDVTTTRPTGVIRNSLTITNLGRVPYVGISVGDDFADSLDDATYNGDATASTGSLVLIAGTGRVVWTGDVPVGATVVVTGSVTVDNPDLGDRVVTNLVTTEATASPCPAADPGPACSTSVSVLIPGLTISKAADTTTVVPGSPVGYTITVTNSGQSPYQAAAVRDPLTGVLSDARYNDDATATSGAVSYTAATLTWTGDLAVGQTVVIGYSVTVHDPDLGGRVMANTVVSDELGSSCPAGGTDPGCSAIVAVVVPALDVAVAADTTSTVPGGTVGYTVTIHNSGQTAYLGATVTTLLTGVLDDAGYGGGAGATAGTLAFTDPNLTWTGDLAVGATAVVTYSVTVADPDTGNRLLSTSVSTPAQGSSCGSAPQCANTVTVLVPGLAVTTTADRTTATPGDRVAYTITVVNTGQTPYTGTVVSTTLTDVLDDATVVGVDGGVVSSSGVATYTAPNLSWTGSLDVGDTATITYAVTVRNPDTGDRTLTSTVVSAASGSTCQDTSTDPACTATVTVLVPGLTISKSAGAPTTTPGGVVGYTILVTNTGQTPYVAAAVQDSLRGVLPDSDYNDDATVTGGGTLDYAEPVLTWTGDLPVGAAATITYSITVHDPDPGDKQMINTVSSTTPGSTCPPASASAACSTLVRVLVPALVITATADPVAVAAGSAVRYTVSLTNSGQTAYAPASFTQSLVDVLDDADWAGDATASAGSVEYGNGTVLWTGPLDVGATATVTYTVATRFPATGDRTLTSTVVSASPGATCATGTEPACRTSVTVLVPALTVTKVVDTSEVVAGGTAGYTISVTNTGQADYPVATLTDPLAGVLDDAVYNGDATATVGAVDYADGTLSWTGGLPVGASVLINFSVTVTVTGTGDGVLANRVVSTSVGSTCAADSTDPGCVTATAVSARTISLTDLTSSFTLTGLPLSTVGSDGTVTMTVTTNSPAGYLVSVQGAAGSLTGSTPGNAATIPLGQLGVRESGTTPFTPLSADAPVVVHEQPTPSAPGGDAVSNDYQVQIPDIASDTYSTTLDYIVSAR